MSLKQKLIQARPTEPCLRNSLNYVFYNINTKKSPLPKQEILQRCSFVLNHFKESEQKISAFGARKIKKRAVVFTHCHSSTVMGVLKEARKHTPFEVYNTETRPLYQGHKTAKELLAAKIPVTMYVDSAARLAIKKADIMLIGCDAITSEGKVINKIGSEMFAEIADLYRIPVYVCTNSWKLDFNSVFGYETVIEQRKKSEVWPSAPKGLKIENPAFEKIAPSLITGIISELGIYSPGSFIQEAKDSYPQAF